jgi:hypothetical protein
VTNDADRLKPRRAKPMTLDDLVGALIRLRDREGHPGDTLIFALDSCDPNGMPIAFVEFLQANSRLELPDRVLIS